MRTPSTHSNSGSTRIDLDLTIPPLPGTVAEIGVLMRRPDGQDVRTLTDVVSADPMLASVVLRRINSAYYGMQREISDLYRAVYLLGFKYVCSLALASAIVRLEDILPREEGRAVFRDIVERSIGTAVFAEELAMELQLRQTTSVYTAGLLHSVGRLVLLSNFPDEYTALCTPGDPTRLPSPTAEMRHFGIDHARLGEATIRRWQLPDELADIIGAVHAPGRLPDGPTRTLALAVGVASAATEQLCLPSNSGLKFEARTALHVLARAARTTADDLLTCIHGQRDDVRQQMGELVGQLAA